MKTVTNPAPITLADIDELIELRFLSAIHGWTVAALPSGEQLFACPECGTLVDNPNLCQTCPSCGRRPFYSEA